MRRLSRKKALSLVKELDAFPKVSESYVETSASGGTGGRPRPLSSASSSSSFSSWTVWLPHLLICSFPDRLHRHGTAGLPGVLCLQRHVDEVRVRGGQGFFQVHFSWMCDLNTHLASRTHACSAQVLLENDLVIFLFLYLTVNWKSTLTSQWPWSANVSWKPSPLSHLVPFN